MNSVNNLLSERIKNVPESFIRKILKISIQSDIISFAGGHPDSGLYPVVEIEKASSKVLQTKGSSTLQYASSEGDTDLREWIANRYREKQGLDISIDNILITNGSQQTFDLLAKVLLNEGDPIALENPGYLGAIQSFSLFQPSMHPVPIDENGMDTNTLIDVLKNHKPKFLYTVPNFQNPTGISYSEENRKAVAQAVSESNTLLIQDDPYGELRYTGQSRTNFYSLLPEQTVLLGSFSKIVVPSMRIGWIVAPKWLFKPLVIAKQAADLHTNFFSQQLIAQYLKDNPLDKHIEKIIQFYGSKKQAMLKAIKEYFPSDVKIAESEGGMFIWATLPEGMSSMTLFDEALKQQVAFVPGEPFYVGDNIKGRENTLRLSFVTVDEATITEGIKRLGACITHLQSSKKGGGAI